MLGWLGALFSSKKVVDTAMDTVGTISAGIDMLVYTDEEKARMNVEVSKLVLERVKLAANESSLRSMTRRIIAVSVVLTAEFLTVVLALSILAGASDTKIKGLWQLLKFWGTPLAIVLAFYLGYYGITKIREAGEK